MDTVDYYTLHLTKEQAIMAITMLDMKADDLQEQLDEVVILRDTIKEQAKIDG